MNITSRVRPFSFQIFVILMKIENWEGQPQHDIDIDDSNDDIMRLKKNSRRFVL